MSPAMPRAPEVGDHAAAFYDSAEELMAIAAPFVRAGAEAEDLVLWISDDLTPDQVADGLRSRGVRVDDLRARGSLAIMSASAAFAPQGRFDVDAAMASFIAALTEAQTAGFRRIRAVVEMTYLLADIPGIQDAPVFESRANDEIFTRFPFLCVCPMNRLRGGEEVQRAVLRSHPLLYERGLVRANPDHVAAPRSQGAVAG